MTARLEIAILAAEDGAGRVYVVEPEAGYEDDPNVTDKEFPGNPTLPTGRKHRCGSWARLLVWASTPAGRLAEMRAFVARSRAEGIEPCA